MPMYQTVAIFIVAVLLSAITAIFDHRLRRDLLRPTFWLLLVTAGGAMSAVSALIGKTRHAGTGLTTNYGWPKPFYFRYLSENNIRSDGWEFIYFAANSLVFIAGLLGLWAIWRFSTR